MKKAVFFDIDGTLWDENMQIPETTITAIKKLRENGHYAFICSGRSRAAIRSKELLEDIGFDGIVAGCGTYVEYLGKNIFEKRLSGEAIEGLLEHLKLCNMPAILEGKNYLYADEKEFGEDPYVAYLKGLLKEGFLPLYENKGNYDANKISADYSKGNIPEIKRRLQENYELVFHAVKAVEILPKGFSKATGIQYICEYLGVSREDTYAFGDSVNDLDMLNYVEHAIAMGNASEDAKEAADYVTSDIWGDGIMKGLLHFELL